MGPHLKLTQNRRRKPRLGSTQFYNIQNNMAILSSKIVRQSLLILLGLIYRVDTLSHRLALLMNGTKIGLLTVHGTYGPCGYYVLLDCPYMNGPKIC